MQCYIKNNALAYHMPILERYTELTFFMQHNVTHYHGKLVRSRNFKPCNHKLNIWYGKPMPLSEAIHYIDDISTTPQRRQAAHLSPHSTCLLKKIISLNMSRQTKTQGTFTSYKHRQWTDTHACIDTTGDNNYMVSLVSHDPLSEYRT